jgi:MSHA biogenesis protein MshP
MKPGQKQQGFTLIAAIFLLVAVAGLVVYMMNIRVVQQTTLVYGVQGARAMQAARSGIQWGIYKALDTSSCPAATSFSLTGNALDNFNISVSCIESTHNEAATDIITFQLTAVATSGIFGSLDFVQRSVRATVSRPPP